MTKGPQKFKTQYYESFKISVGHCKLSYPTWHIPYALSEPDPLDILSYPGLSALIKAVRMIVDILSYLGSPKIKNASIYLTLMGEGFIHLTKGYGFMVGVYHAPFDTLKICTYTYDMKLKLYR